MKVVIPVAGAGAKLRPFTYTQPKCLIPLAGKTILSFIIDDWMEAGATEFIFVVGHLGEKIRDFILEKYPQIIAHFVVQVERDGTGHAVSKAQDFVAEGEEVYISFGDTICDNLVERIVQSEHSCVGIKKVENPTLFGVAEIDINGKVLHVEEKPSVPKTNYALVGIYKIKEARLLFEIINQQLLAHAGDEKYNLTSAIETMLKKEIYFDSIEVENWYDCGRKETLLKTNASLLSKMNFASDAVPFFDNTIIIHPVSIADNCSIENAIVGPNVTVGENAKIESSIISNSIIGSFSELNRVVLHDSLIGSDANIHGYSQSLNIGDNTEIDLRNK